MTPREPPRFAAPDRSPVSAADESVGERLAATELRLRQLETACNAALLDASGVSLGSPCPACERSLLLVARGTLSCPACSERRTL